MGHSATKCSCMDMQMVERQAVRQDIKDFCSLSLIVWNCSACHRQDLTNLSFAVVPVESMRLKWRCCIVMNVLRLVFAAHTASGLSWLLGKGSTGRIRHTFQQILFTSQFRIGVSFRTNLTTSVAAQPEGKLPAQ